MERLKTVTHRGRSILMCDYSHLTAPVRSLSIMTGSRMSAKATETMKAVTQMNRPYIKVSAIVGLNPLQRMVLIKTVERDADRSWAAFDTLEEALDWLAKPD